MYLTVFFRGLFLKILYVISTLKNCGPVNVLYSLCKELCSKNEISILTLSPEPQDSRWKDFSKLDITINSLCLTRCQFSLFGDRSFKKFLETNEYDVIHSHGFRADFLLSKVKHVRVKVSTAHNNPEEDYISTYGWIIGKWMIKRQMKYWQEMTRVVSCSYSINKAIGEKLDNTIVVQNGSRKIGNGKNCKGENEVSLVSVGSLTGRKNTEFILKNFDTIQDQCKRIKLKIVGDGPLYAELRQRYESSRVIFTGKVQSPDKYLLKSKWFISASKSEGLPMAVIESMSADCNLLLSDIGPHKEIRDAIGNSSICTCFNLDNDTGLQKCLLAIDRGSVKWHSGSQSYWKTYFSDVVMSKKYLSVYSDLCNV